MANTRQLKSRIKSVKSNKQITKAMELVAASKLRRAQEATKASEEYARSARELLTQLSHMTEVERNIYFQPRKIKNRLVILITSNRGLAGAYNTNVGRQFISQLSIDKAAGVTTHVIAIGKKGAAMAAKIKGVEIAGVYNDLPAQITAASIRPILTDAVNRFLEEKVDAIDVVTTQFINSFVQTATSFRLLPGGFSETEVSEDIALATFEPSVEEVLEGATIRLLEAQLYQALLDAAASEHSMRRVAMKNATDNANDLIEDLSLEMNKVRQAAITQELAEISGGAEAMK